VNVAIMKNSLQYSIKFVTNPC